MPDLDAGLYGECQAALLNLEQMITAEFGAQYAMADQLAVSLQFTQLIPAEKKRAAKRLTKATRTVKDYVETFRAGLPSSTLNSTKYSFNVFLVPKVGNKKDLADAAVEFIKVDDASPEELARLEKINVLIKEKHIPIANLDLRKPTQVVAEVAAKLPHKFTLPAHIAAWQHFKVRPKAGASNDYLYTEAWIDKLSKDLANAEAFQEITGLTPVPK